VSGAGEPRTAAPAFRFAAAGRPLGIAHRGASHAAPENTLAAFRLALAAGVDGVECDVRRTRDRHLVVIHDPAVDRTTDGRGPVAALSLEALRRLDAGRWFGTAWAGERVPRFEEVLDLVRGRARIFVEIKNDPDPAEGVERQVVAALRERGMEGEALVMSFDHRAVRAVRAAAPAIATGILYSARLIDPAAAARAAAADALCIQGGYLDAAVVDAARRAGLGVVTWTVDDPALFRRCAALGVDAIISDDLPLLASLRGVL
jgi:glycerophosphoryl diester phosphodiesterase